MSFLASLSTLCLAPAALAQIEHAWSLGETTPLAAADDEVTALAATGTDHLLFAVHSSQPAGVATRVRCRDLAGALVWELDPAPAGTRFVQAHTRRGGGAFFCGTWSAPGSPARIVATRIEENGSQLWTSQWTPASFDPSVDLVQSTLDDAGNLWVVGTVASGQRVFVRRLSQLGVLLAFTEFQAPARTSIRAACGYPGGGVVTVGEQDQRPLVRVFGSTGAVQWSHAYANVSVGAPSSYSDVIWNAKTARVYASGTVNGGTAAQDGLIGVFETSGAMFQGLRTSAIYGPGHPASFEAITERTDGRPHAIGRMQWNAPQWSAFWLEILPNGNAGYGLSTLGAPGESIYPGSRLLAGSVDQLWVASPWGPLAAGHPTHWIVEEYNLFHYTAASFDAFTPGPGGDPARWLGLERTRDGLALFGSLGPQLDGTTDGQVALLDTSAMPTGYCVAEASSAGCIPFLSYTGQLWYFTQQLHVFAGNLPNQSSALMLYSTTGPTVVPFLGGTLCVAPPLRRSAVSPTGGSSSGVVDCSGSFGMQMSTLLGPDPYAHVPGNEIFLQVWSRDPVSGTGRGTGAMRITVP